MDFNRVLCCLGLMLVACAAQEPIPCTVPPLMSGGFTVMTTSIMSTGKITYDAYGQRMRVRTFSFSGNVTDQLMLFNKKVYYEIDWSRFTCKKMPLDTSFVPMQVPSDAQLMGQVVMGSSSSWGMGVLVNTWYGSLPGNGSYSSVFTEIGCIPLTTSLYTPASGWTTLSTFDWVVGISTAMDFVPPSFCAKSSLEERETPDTFFTALGSLAMKSKRMV
ncbi:ependymin-2-like isoform X2 [Scomber japonicus]|uniref:ependymin-2-like isoform X2 n=1 Tax=Scomber japonicus TaxID=13676 RepID=UPI0023055F10|nr:ependymin-2-like isoform X2 [Scomber japonicus]